MHAQHTSNLEGDGLQQQMTTSDATPVNSEQKTEARIHTLQVDNKKTGKKTNIAWSDEAQFLLHHGSI